MQQAVLFQAAELAVGSEAHNLCVEALSNLALDAFEGTTSDKQDVFVVDRNQLLFRVLASALWWHIHNRTF